MFKAYCKGWNYACSGEAHPFDPWILKSEDISESEVVNLHPSPIFRFFKVFFLALVGKRTTLIGCSGSRRLVTLDTKDWSIVFMLNPLSPREHIRFLDFQNALLWLVSKLVYCAFKQQLVQSHYCDNFLWANEIL
jgi:hypothetical protein